MSIVCRPYTSVPGITSDYALVREMLCARGYCEYTYARWDWATTHPNLNCEKVNRMSLWLENGRAVAATLMDCYPGTAYLLCLPGYEFLRDEMLDAARERLTGDDGKFGVVIPESDTVYQSFAVRRGLTPTPDCERDAAFFTCETSTDYLLPEGFRITDMQETYDLYQYGRVLWKGFNHEAKGEGPFDPKNTGWCAPGAVMKRPNVDLSLKIAAVTPDGNFCAYCGMWYEPKAGFAIIEPVATDPAYRKMGLGRAVVLEGVRRVKEKGARLAIVGSDQQFYYNIGLRPYATNVIWR